MIAITLSASAQYYLIPNVGANSNPGNLNNDLEEPGTAAAPWVTLLPTSATPTWSANQTIPFTFMFNGVTETSYKVSSTGVLTFDVATAVTACIATNAALPSALVPDKSICVWGVNANGANDKVITRVFGTAPNRQLWISFNSCSNVASTTSFIYWSIVLEETTNSIHIVDQRSSSSTGSVTLAITAGLQFNASSAMMVPGSPALNSTTGATAGSLDTPADNTYYTFKTGVQPAVDIKLVDVTPHDGDPASYVSAPANVPLTVKVVNYGSAAITGFTFTYNTGAGPVNDVKTGLNIAPFANYTFTAATPVAVTATGHVNVACNVSLAGDADLTNDAFTTGLNGIAFTPVHNVVFEEGTGTWCGWCVRGLVYMDSIQKTYPDAVCIAVHNGDPMTVAAYDAGIGGLISGYPSVVVDRKIVDDPSNLFQLYLDHKPDFGYADITMTNTVSGSNVTCKVDCHFAVDLTGSYRLALVATEDRVHGGPDGSTWDQHNYYSSQSQNIPLLGYGFDFQAEASIIVASKMYYDDVAISIDNSFTGKPGTITSPIAAGSTQSYTFNYAIPSTSKGNNISLKALLIDQNSGMIMNANQKHLEVGGAVQSIASAAITAEVYPNPAADQLNVSLQLTASQSVKVEVLNMIGQTVATATQTLKNGVVTMNIAALPVGNYGVKITAGNETVTRKITKQ